ncbi:hypothetical protein [Streptomyces sp. NPDC003642]
MEPDTELTDEQREAYAENEADLGRLETHLRDVQGTATARLTTAGLTLDPDATNCLLCPCKEFKGDTNLCGRPGCRHSRLRHQGFI